jgi:hypothetical protein
MEIRNAKLFHWAVYAAKAFSDGGHAAYSGDVRVSSSWSEKPIKIRATVATLPDETPSLDRVGWVGSDGNRHFLEAVKVAEMRKAFAAVSNWKRKPFFPV